MGLMKNKKQIALILAISSMSGIVTPTIFSLRELNSYAYTNEYNLTEKEKQEYGIKKIEIYGIHTLFLKEDGTVWTCGWNEKGQLGIGNNIKQSTPVKVNIDNVRDVISGYQYTMFLKEDGTVWSCGWNNYGQLGIGNNTDQNTPVQVDIDNVKQIFCSYSHTFFMKNDGTVWATGYNKYGQLGIGNIEHQNIPVKVDITDVKDIIGGGYHTVFIKKDGTVFGTGYNNNGGLGIEDWHSIITPTKLPIDNVKEVTCGLYYTAFLKEDGTVWSTGQNNYGQLGIGNTVQQRTPVKVNIENIKHISGGTYHTVLLKEDGTVWGMGQNKYGELAIGNTIQQNTPIKANIDNVKEIIGGYDYTFFVKNDNTIWACGHNYYRQFGIDTTNFETLPIELTNSIYTIEELVLKAESSKLQSDFAIAKEKVDEMSTSPEKNEFQNRLNILQLEINTIKTAIDLLEILEQNKNKDNISVVQDSINLIIDGTIKKQLQDRLDNIKNEIYANDVNYSKLLQNAKDKLEKAESSKNSIDITFTQLAIDKLNPEDKLQFQEKLNTLKDEIKLEQEIINYNKLFEDAEIKTTKAEETKSNYDITVAKDAINKLKPEDKTPLQDIINILEYNILLEDANLKVLSAEELRTDTSISIAQIAVDKVPIKEVQSFALELVETELVGKVQLQNKLDNLKLSLEEERYLQLLQEANTNVTNAESSKSLKDIKLAQMSIDRLKEIDKTQLQERLDNLKALMLQEEKDTQDVKLAINKVEQAEATKTQKYIDEAKILVNSLKESEEKTNLLDRINAIEQIIITDKIKTLVYQADVYVKQAEALKREPYITKAQTAIDKLPTCEEKTLLQARLDKVKK